MGDETLNQSPTPAPTAAPATTAPDFSAVPGHQIEDSSVMTTPKAQQDANTQTVTLPRMGRVKMNTEENPGDFVEGLNKFTEPIENYTPQGRKEHPVLAQLGDVTRNVKEALEGGKAAGKPMGTSASPFVEEANVLSGAEGGAEDLAKGEELVREYAPKAIGHLAEAGKGFLTDLLEEARAGLEAKHPEGSLEAGFAKIPGYRKEPAPELPKKVTSAKPKTTNAAAEAKLVSARAGAAPDLEKNPTSIPEGAKTSKQVTHVDPNAFIDAVNPGGQTAKEDVVQKYQQKIRAGEELPPNKVEYNEHGQITGADGRHRAEASRREDVPLKIEATQVLRPGEHPEENYAYRSRNVGEKGVPSQSHAQATSDPDEAARIAIDREKVEGKPQELVKIPLHKLQEGDYTAKPGPNGGDWIKFNRDLGEHEVEPHTPEQPPTEPPATASEAAPDEEEPRYHPDLQKIVDKYGATDDPYSTAHGASFIAPDGQFIHLSGTSHDTAIESTTNRLQSKLPSQDIRTGFMNDTGAIRTRASFGRNGHTLNISVPEKGVTPDQIDALKGAARATLGSGKSGNIVMETADGAKSAKHEFANANNIEPMLKEIGAHPDKETPADTTPWNEKAAKLHEQNGGFTINPRTGNVPQSGHVVEAVPEARQVSDKPNTPEQIQKFADKNKKLLAKNPELHIGGYTNDAGKHELNISAVTNDSAKAEKVAKALDQESMYNVGENKVVPTGGKNVQQAFPDYPVAQRLRDLAPEEPGMTISTRQPSSVKYSTEDPLRHNLRLTNDLISKNPALADKWANVVKDYPGFQAPEGADTQTTLNAFIEHAKDNLKHLYNSLPVEDQEKNKVWYDGAHTLTKELADKHGITHPQAAGVVAALSPQKDWDQNVSLARRLTDIVKNQQDTVAGPDMLAKAKEIREASTTAKNPNANKYLVELAKSIQGKKLSELSDVDKKAAFVRLHDEINNPRKYFKINPDGSSGEIYKKADGTDGQVAWGSLNEIGKAINILEDGSRENISDNLGQAHKVRHFYNNIIEPNSARGDVTVDTHAVAAALMRPLGGKNPEVLANFEGPSSNIHGLNGTYPLYHEAYTRAAKELDIAHPRQLQSVVWEHIRNQFPAEFKTKENQDAVNGIWKEAQNGKITAEDARKQILEYAQGHRVAADEGIQRPSDQTELSGHGVHGESAGGHGRGDRGEHSVGSETERPPAESSGKETTGGWLKMLQSKPKK